ncbi:MAG: NAD(P)/FAD-dependent oxidoreductase [Thiotrichales bacterium]|nr:NAD(P)/FAD-dependent oxidoreductase [Thiotrichales bacterium]
MQNSTHDDKGQNGFSRRDFLLGAAASFAYFAGMERAIAASGNDTPVKIVIVGSGSAGISIANRLADALPNGQIVIIDKREPHYYWPGLTLVATGVWPKADVLPGSNESFLPKGKNISFMKTLVSAFEPEKKQLQTEDGQTVSYDYLVVATGIEYNYEAIDGMDIERIGQKGLTSVYHSPDKAEASWGAIRDFSEKGGNGIFTLPATPIRCAGAPLKMTFLTLDRLKQNGGFDKGQMNFYSATGGVFGLPWFNQFVLDRFAENKMDVKLKTPLKAVDIDAQKATFGSAEGESFTVEYDLLHVVPPMRAPKVVRESDLAWKEGGFAGWLAVDKNTLQHNSYPEVFGCGDVNGTPLGKTAATVKMSVPIVVSNLLSVINGKEPEASFNGYTSCPLITQIGSAMLIEFDYEKNLVPTYPFIDPQQESWFAWIMKEQLLKPAYLKMLEGKV